MFMQGYDLLAFLVILAAVSIDYIFGGSTGAIRVVGSGFLAIGTVMVLFSVPWALILIGIGAVCYWLQHPPQV